MLDDGTVLLAMTVQDQKDCLDAAKLLAVIAALPVAEDLCAKLADQGPAGPALRIATRKVKRAKPGATAEENGTQAICMVCKKPFVRTTSQKTCGETCRKKRNLEQKLAFKRRAKLATQRETQPAGTEPAADARASRLDLIRAADRRVTQAGA